MKRLLAATLLGLCCLSGLARAGGTSVVYRLYHFEGGSWVQYYPSDLFPAGSDLAGANRWRYDYILYNNSAPGAINTLQAFFNSDGLLHADPPPAAVTPPGGWSPTYFAPPLGQQAWRERFRNLATPVGVGSSMGYYSVEFFWHDPVFPGSQPYDAQFSTGSETGLTTPVRRSTPSGNSTWGGMRKRYR